MQHKRTLKIKSELSAFKYAVENSDNSIVLTDPNRKILYVNDIFEKNTGYLKDELLGEKPKVLSSGLTAQEIYDDLNEKLNSGKKWEGEFINKRKNGTIFYVITSYSIHYTKLYEPLMQLNKVYIS